MSNSILIIADSIALHELIKTRLKPDGLSVHSAFDREAGLATAMRIRPALILLDVDMPGIEALEVVRRLRFNPLTAATLIIFLTALPRLADRSKGLDAGVFDYVLKPIETRDLRLRVGGALRWPSRLEIEQLVDPATGLWNRAYLDAHVEEHISLAKRFRTSLTCILIEMNDSQAMIERFGETFVADVLRGLGRILAGGCRADGLVCRYDRWIFAILATNTNRAGGTLIGLRLRNEIERQMRFGRGQETGITCSVGVAQALVPDDGSMMSRAEAALKLAGSRAAIAI